MSTKSHNLETEMTPEQEILHVIGVSGGKDSTALALRLREIAEEKEYVFLCTPTGDELPEMNAHWKHLENVLGAPLTRVTPGYDLAECCHRNNSLPSWRMRFCTRELKIQPCQRWIGARVSEGFKVILYVGLRADEEGREGGKYQDCEVRFPLREWGWGLKEVKSYLAKSEINIPSRTDCARCFFQTLPEWWALWKQHPEIYQDAVNQEKEYGHTFRSPSRDTWPAALEDLRARFASGDLPRGLKNQEDPLGFAANKCRVCSL